VLVYLGVGFLLFGTFLIIVTATGGFNLAAFTALGGLVSAMGLVLSFVALKTRDQADNETTLSAAAKSHDAIQPLTYLQTRIELNFEKQRESSGTKAFGFVLIALGIFVSAAGIIGPSFGFGLLGLTGFPMLAAGVLLRRS
jgi:hypothetical protein